MRDNLRQGDQNIPGERKFDRQMDSEPTRALTKFSAIMDSLLTPKASIWHRLRPSDEVLLKDRDVQLYFQELNNALFRFRYTPEANFSSQNQLVYRGLGSFGSAAMFIDRLDTGRGLRYKHCHVGELFWEENHQGIVNDVIRAFKLKAKQLVQKPLWAGNLTEDLVREAEANPTREYTILHHVRPRADFAPDNIFDERGLPFTSDYVLKEKNLHLHSGGFRSFPYAPTRYEESPNEKYGRSPAMQVFASIRSLNAEKRAVLKAGHRQVDPVILVSDDGVMQNVSLRPGAVVSGGVSPSGQPLVTTLPAGNPAFGEDLMNQEKEDIRDAFLIRLFQILVDGRDRMTATEVLERAREKGMLLAPTVGRQETEYLGPMISREIEVLTQQGLVPEQPPALIEAEGEFTIVYDSPLSKAARAEEAAGFVRTVDTLLPVINTTGDVSPLDNFDMDVIAQDYASIQAVNPKWMRDPRSVASIRQARQQAQQAQQDAENAAKLLPGVASAKKAGVTEEDLG